MTVGDEKLKAAIDEALAPLIADHRRYVAFSDPDGIPVARTDLHYVYDQYNTERIDLTGTMIPVGHNHPFVTEAIKEHLRYYLRTGVVGEQVLRWPVEYAANLVKTFLDDPEDDEPRHQVLYTEGERDALLTAIQLAHQLRDGGIAAVDTRRYDWASAVMHGTITLLPPGEFWLHDFRWEDKSCLVLSLAGEDGTLLDKRWVQEVADHAARNGLILVVDETLTGFGRLGTMWGHQAYSITPDLVVVGGPFGGSLPLGAVIAEAETFSKLDVDHSPQAGSPVACAAGAGVLRAINPGVLEHVKDAGADFGEALRQLAGQFPEFLSAARGRGLWWVLEFHNPALTARFVAEARQHGLLMRQPEGTAVVVLTPPLIMSDIELRRCVDLMSETLLDWVEAPER